MSTIPTPHQFTAGEYPTAANLNSGAYTGVLFALGGGSGRKETFRAHMATAQSVPNSSSTTIKFDTVDEDTDSAYSTSTGVFTCVTPGLYLFVTYVSWAANTSGVRTLEFASTGDPTACYAPTISPTAPFTSAPCTLPFRTRLAEGDTVEVKVNQTSGGALNTATGIWFSGVMESL